MPDFAGEVLALCSWSGKIFSWSGKIFATDRSPEVVLIPNGEFKIGHYRPMPATRATRRLASKAAFVRSSARFRYDKGVRYYANGFRVARGFASRRRQSANQTSEDRCRNSFGFCLNGTSHGAKRTAK
jgi:formylglycine-generating enzyme required for sulfatase activity